jgi:transcriptional regulator with XRE-family HTH domain
MAIGNNIRKLRISKNISQQIVADNLNIDRRTYAAWEQGAQDVKSTFIPQLADFFGVEITDLFEDDKGFKSAKPLKTAPSTRLF